MGIDAERIGRDKLAVHEQLHAFHFRIAPALAEAIERHLARANYRCHRGCVRTGASSRCRVRGDVFGSRAEEAVFPDRYSEVEIEARVITIALAVLPVLTGEGKAIGVVS